MQTSPLLSLQTSSQVFSSEEEAAQVLRRFILETEIVVTINSDDPAYFGGYLLDNYRLVQRLLGLDIPQMARLAKNSFTASFISDQEREAYFSMIDVEVQREAGTSNDATEKASVKPSEMASEDGKIEVAVTAV